MATLSFYNPYFVGQGAGVTMTALDMISFFDYPMTGIDPTSTRLLLLDDEANFLEINGTGLTYDFVGDQVDNITGGTITHMREVRDFRTVISLTGLNHSALTLNNLFNDGNGIAIRNFLFSGDDWIKGTSLGDALFSGARNDTLRGEAGNDTLNGQAGNDTIYGGDDDDLIQSGSGNDRAQGDAGNDRVYGNQGDDRLYGNAGLDRLYGGTENDQLYGGDDRDFLYGEAGNDVLRGDAGDDYLYGGLGRDVLTGGIGRDRFVFNTAPDIAANADVITDFSRIDDTMLLDDAAFIGIGPTGRLATGALALGTSAQDADDRIVYDQATGRIYFDADGAGGAAQILFARITAGTVLTEADFVII